MREVPLNFLLLLLSRRITKAQMYALLRCFADSIEIYQSIVYFVPAHKHRIGVHHIVATPIAQLIIAARLLEV